MPTHLLLRFVSQKVPKVGTANIIAKQLNLTLIISSLAVTTPDKISTLDIELEIPSILDNATDRDRLLCSLTPARNKASIVTVDATPQKLTLTSITTVIVSGNNALGVPPSALVEKVEDTKKKYIRLAPVLDENLSIRNIILTDKGLE